MPKSAPSPSPSPSSPRRRRPKNLRAPEATRLLVAHERSGLSLAEFERRHDLSPNRLSWWRKRLGLLAAPTATATATTGRRAPAAVTFLPVRVEVPTPVAPAPPTPAPAPPIELVLPDGVVLRVPPSFDAAALTRILDVLCGTRAC